jgi:hypothetical protein
VQVSTFPFRLIKQLLTRWPLQMLGGALLVVSALVVFYTFESSQRVVLQYATESAREHAESVTQFRNFYAQELVPRAVRAGVSVTHDYKSTDNALPLPATLTIIWVTTCRRLMAARKCACTAIYRFHGEWGNAS